MAEPMNKKTCFLLLIGCAFMLPTTQAQTVKFNNELARCLQLEAPKLSRTDNLLLAKIRFTLEQSTGECGCTSALATYSSRLDPKGAIVQQGQWNVMHNADLYLVLSSWQIHDADPVFHVTLGCTPPL